MIRNAAILLLALFLTVFTGTLGLLVPSHVWLPHPLLPAVLFLGVTHDVSVIRGALLTFVMGYLFDLFSGNPMGLQTFVLMGTFATARYAGLRLFMRGTASRLGLTFAVGLLAGVTMLALRAIFELPPPFPVSGVSATVRHVVYPSLTTTLLALPVFALCQWANGLTGRRASADGVRL